MSSWLITSVETWPRNGSKMALRLQMVSNTVVQVLGPYIYTTVTGNALPVCSRESTHSSSRSRERPIFGNKIDPQPLVLNPESQLYNIRKLIELPHSLARALQGDKLKGLLTDYQWLCAGNVTNTIEDTMKAFTTMAPKVPIGRLGN